MPSNKIFVALILCASTVVSVWLITRAPANIITTAQSEKSVSLETIRNARQDTTDIGDNWKKILTTVSTQDQKVTDVTPKTSSDTFDDTTLTAQMARDFFGQYLSVAKSGQAVTIENANAIAGNVLTLPEYTQTKAVVYVITNIHVNLKTDIDTVKKYNQTLVNSLTKHNAEATNDPLAILSIAVSTNNADALRKLDPIIEARKGIIHDLLAMDVPESAATFHLALLNAYSSLLSSLEAMRVTFSDPVKSFSGANQYDTSVANLKVAVQNINTYFNNTFQQKH
jgi:hypothetical protein